MLQKEFYQKMENMKGGGGGGQLGGKRPFKQNSHTGGYNMKSQHFDQPNKKNFHQKDSYSRDYQHNDKPYKD